MKRENAQVCPKGPFTTRLVPCFRVVSSHSSSVRTYTLEQGTGFDGRVQVRNFWPGVTWAIHSLHSLVSVLCSLSTRGDAWVILNSGLPRNPWESVCSISQLSPLKFSAEVATASSNEAQIGWNLGTQSPLAGLWGDSTLMSIISGQAADATA